MALVHLLTAMNLDMQVLDGGKYPEQYSACRKLTLMGLGNYVSEYGCGVAPHSYLLEFTSLTPNTLDNVLDSLERDGLIRVFSRVDSEGTYLSEGYEFFVPDPHKPTPNLEQQGYSESFSCHFATLQYPESVDTEQPKVFS